MGRPTNNPKTIVKRARMSEEDVEKLKYCCDTLKLSESDVLRMGIDEVYQRLKKQRFTPLPKASEPLIFERKLVNAKFNNNFRIYYISFLKKCKE